MSKPGTNFVDYEVVQNVAVVTLDHYPVNSLTNAVSLGLESALEKVRADSSLKGVIFRGAGQKAFCAGAHFPDLSIPHKKYPEKPFFDDVHDINVPSLALLQGFTLGGGLETALACNYRLITPNGVVGLPEVDIGLLPGGQGTQRVPRIIGAEASLKFLLSGKHMGAKKAEQVGLVDKVLEKISPEETLQMAVDFIKSSATADFKDHDTSKFNPKFHMSEDEYDALAKKIVPPLVRKRPKQVAPAAIVKCIRAAVAGDIAKDFSKGVDVEQELFFGLITSDQAKALQYVFFGERAAPKLSFLKEQPGKPINVKTVAVLGAGTMGGGISMCLIEAKYNVFLIDRDEKALNRGISVIKRNYETSVKRGSRSQKSVEAALGRLKTLSSIDLLGKPENSVDMVIEAVFEDLDLKKRIFKQLDEVCPAHTILASNTSYLNIDAMAEGLSKKREGKVIGMHFFSPANVMPLLENIRGKDLTTSPSTIRTATVVGQRIGKWPVLVRNRHGFVANRVMAYYSKASMDLLYSGVPLTEVDKAAVQFGFPMGPISMADLAGLDIGFQAREKAGQVDKDKNIRDALIMSGRLGMKNGKGFYDYEGRKKSVSAEADAIIAKVVANVGKPKLTLTIPELQDRLFLAVVNDCFKLLEEKVAESPSDVDVILVHGYSWPRATGGPLKYAELRGLQEVLAALKDIDAKVPNAGYKPCKLLEDVVASGKPLAKFWSKNANNYVFTEGTAKL
eukprot:snap_masked-scaffold_49-processed-gene-0.10-mRNA-1 protein AED:0.01 eAED:0.01 QI:0/-1/0/1/-1/1/1/0/733